MDSLDALTVQVLSHPLVRRTAEFAETYVRPYLMHAAVGAVLVLLVARFVRRRLLARVPAKTVVLVTGAAGGVFSSSVGCGSASRC